MACRPNIRTGPIRVVPYDYGSGSPPPVKPPVIDINDLSGEVQSGRSGISGFSGYSGQYGHSGYSGLSGRSGYSGPSGISGFSGYGVDGLSGYSGYSGTSGESGTSGTSGSMGISGVSGFSGSTGSGVQEKNIYNTFSSTHGLMPYTVKVGRSSCLNYQAVGTYALDFHLDIPEDIFIGTDAFLVFNYNMSTSSANSIVLKLEMDVIDQGGNADPLVPVYSTTDIITVPSTAYINEELIYDLSGYITNIHQSIRFTLSRLADDINDTHAGDFNVENTSFRYTGLGSPVYSGQSGFSGFINTSSVTTFTAQFNSAKYTTTTSINWNNGNVQYIVLSNGANVLAFANPIDGGRYVLILKQPAAGAPGTVTWPAEVLWSSGITPTLTVTNSKTDLMSFVYDGTNVNYYGVSNLDF